MGGEISREIRFRFLKSENSFLPSRRGENSFLGNGSGGIAPLNPRLLSLTPPASGKRLQNNADHRPI